MGSRARERGVARRESLGALVEFGSARITLLLSFLDRSLISLSLSTNDDERKGTWSCHFARGIRSLSRYSKTHCSFHLRHHLTARPSHLLLPLPRLLRLSHHQTILQSTHEEERRTSTRRVKHKRPNLRTIQFSEVKSLSRSYTREGPRRSACSSSGGVQLMAGTVPRRTRRGTRSRRTWKSTSRERSSRRAPIRESTSPVPSLGRHAARRSLQRSSTRSSFFLFDFPAVIRDFRRLEVFPI